MRTYDDTFSGQKLYPGKVRQPQPTARELSTQPAITSIPGWMTVEATISPADIELSMRSAKISCNEIGQTLRPRRQQDLPLPKRQNRIAFPPTQEPPSDRMDGALSKTA